MYRVDYLVDNHLTTGKCPYCLLGSFSRRDIKSSSKQRGAAVFWHLI